MQVKDFFFLCHGNDVRLLGMVTSKPKRDPDDKKWLLRKYQKLWDRREGLKSGRFRGPQKGWTPNYDSTCFLVPRDQLQDCERQILKPFFGKTLADLAKQAGKRLDEPSNGGKEPRVVRELRRAGFQTNVHIRTLVEDYAMGLAKRFFQKHHYTVDDTHRTRPYDLLCNKGRKSLFVEVKGTESAGRKVILTRNEVRHLRRHFGQCILFVVHSIRVRKRKGISLSAGSIKHSVISDLRQDKLKAIAYEFRVPDS
jgi:hypothetical protein